MAKRAEDFNFDGRLKLLVYGDSGAGKTTFAATFPKPYFFDFDQGIMSAVGTPDLLYEDYDRDPAKALATYNKFIKDAREAQALIKSGEVQTVVIDSLTTMADVFMAYILNDARRANTTPQIQDYQRQQSLIVQTLNQFFGMGAHVLALGHYTFEKDEVTGTTKAVPLIPGQLKGKLGMYFDEAYFATVKGGNLQKQGEYVLQTRKSGLYDAKSRLTGMLQKLGHEGVPPVLENPSYEDLQELMEQLKGGPVKAGA